MMNNKRGAANGSAAFMWVIGIGFVLLLYNMGAIPGLASARGGGGGAAGPGGMIQVNVTGNTCNVDSTILTLGSVEGFYSGAKLTTLSHRWWLNEVDQGVVLDGTTRTVAPGDDIRILYNLNGSSTSFVPAESKFKIPCTGAFTAATADSVYKDAYKLYNMTRAADFAATVNNQNGAVNAAGTPQVITAGQVKKMPFQLQFPNRAAFGTVGSDSALVMCFRNTSYFQTIDLASGKAKYAGQIPTRVGVTSGFAVEAWEFSAPKNNEIIADTLVVTADPTNPTTATNQNVNCTLVDKVWYMPTLSNVPTLGYQNDANADVGTVDLSLLFRTNGTG